MSGEGGFHEDVRALGRLASHDAARRIPLSKIVSALSYALDLTEGQPMGHSVRSCAIGLKIAEALSFSDAERTDLRYALLLKDAGCSSNASRMYQILGGDERLAKRDVKTQDWTRVGMDTLRYLERHVRRDRPVRERLMAILQMAVRKDEQTMDLIRTRCTRGAEIVRKMGFSETTAEAIASLDEHWNGKGYPARLRGHEIPIFAQILNLAQTVDVYATLHGPEEALDVARRRSGRWFNPELVSAVLSWGAKDEIWTRTPAELIEGDDVGSVEASEDRLDDICESFAEIIDAKSPFTFRHSTGVARAADVLAGEFHFDAQSTRTLRRAALLHDIGKLGVSNDILEKPGKLDAAEWEVVRRHPAYTEKILSKVPVFDEFATVAASHHEKLDGSGYHHSLFGSQMGRAARILAVADIYDALAADRPYRQGMPREKVFRILDADAPHKLDGDCVEALKAVAQRPGWDDDQPTLEADSSRPVATMESETDLPTEELTRVF